MSLESTEVPRKELVPSAGVENLPTVAPTKLEDISRDKSLVPIEPTEQEVIQLQEVRERLGLGTDPRLLTYERKLLENHAENKDLIVPEGEVTRVFEFTDEEIANAQKEAEIIDAEYTIVDVVELASKNAANERVRGQREALSREFGGVDNLSNVPVWETIRGSSSSARYTEFMDTMNTVLPEARPNSIWARILRYYERLTDSSRVGETSDEDPHAVLSQYIEERGSELSDDELGEVEDALQLVGLHDQYLFYEEGKPQNLKESLQLQQQLLDVNGKFDPDRTGLPEVRGSIEKADAALQLDFDSKPGYAKEHPEYVECEYELITMSNSIQGMESKMYFDANGHDVPEKIEMKERSL